MIDLAGALRSEPATDSGPLSDPAEAAPGRSRPRRNGRPLASSPKKTTASKKTTAKTYDASGRPGKALPRELADAVADLERELDMPIWLIIQPGHASGPLLDRAALMTFLATREELAKSGRVALIIDSPGGYAEVAYKIARMLGCHAGGFTAVVPRYAKSAATLLTLGANEVVMGPDAELGPLDVQIYDEEREERGSALDEVQALEQLHQVGLEQLNKTMVLMRLGTRKRSEVLLPHACKLVSDMMAPLLAKIDTVHYAKQARLLKVAEEYAIRLMVPTRGREAAKEAADKLVNRYPQHGFVIDREEAKGLVNVIDTTDEVNACIWRIENYLWGDNPATAVGRFKEMK